MKKLKASQFDRARDFIFTKARWLEMRLFEFHFDQNSNSSPQVVKELKRFQNPDSGLACSLGRISITRTIVKIVMVPGRQPVRVVSPFLSTRVDMRDP
jgi:hypothetical protein